MKLPQLPEKYYLTHFEEFLGYITGPCAVLLTEAQRGFIDDFMALSNDQRCMLVRIANRKSPLIKRDSLGYEEIAHCNDVIDQLLQLGHIRQLSAEDFPHRLTQLDKTDLLTWCDANHLDVRRSATKASLLETACAYCNDAPSLSPDGLEHLLLRTFDHHLEYFRFVFFGELNSTLNKFSMRDMGIMRTRKRDASQQARFATLQAAHSAYVYANRNRDVKEFDVSSAQQAVDELASLPSPEGELATHYHDKYLLKLGKLLVNDAPEEALTAWSRSGHQDAREKAIRLSYKLGNHEQVRQQLEAILENPDSEHMLVFAEDFLARKYDRKRTSILTDMLRNGSRIVELDEMHRHQVEKGVQRNYQQQGWLAKRTENRIWLSLFGLVFWQELHDGEAPALLTEFDWQPRVLRDNTFYQQCEVAIENRLASFGDNSDLFRHLSAVATRHYGKPNGIFRWHPSMLDNLKLLVEHSDLASITSLLRRMTQDYKALSDGFPDLMVVRDNTLVFEEVKAPGDQLRKNQLVSIRAMQQAGFEVVITRVVWTLDPYQPYVVVDVETTGGKGGNHRITEIGMVKVINGEISERWQSLLNPQRRIPSFITRLTGITDEMVSDAPLFAEVADEVEAFCEGCVFVAHNVNFDFGFFKAEFERLERRFSMPKLCTVSEMRKAAPGLKSYSLANLCKAFSIDMTRHHRALSDAEAAAQLLNIINEHRFAQLAEVPALTDVSTD